MLVVSDTAVTRGRATAEPLIAVRSPSIARPLWSCAARSPPPNHLTGSNGSPEWHAKSRNDDGLLEFAVVF